MRTTSSLACAATLFFALCTTTAARADDGAPAELPAPRPTSAEATRWYGWQTLLVDVGAVGLGALVGKTDGAGGGAAVGLTLYSLAPLVHVAHDRGATAGGDFALRLGTPLVAGAIGYGVGVATFQGCASGEWLCSKDLAGMGGAVIGAAGGALLAVILDATVLGRERVTQDPASPTASNGVRWSPQVAVTPKGEPSVGVGGTF